MKRLAAVFTIGLLAGSTLAQTQSQQPPIQRDQTKGQPSAAPRPMSGLGGVRSGAPRPQPITGPRANPDYKPMQVGPWPGKINNPPSRPSGNGGIVPRSHPAHPSNNHADRPQHHHPRDVWDRHGRIRGVVTTGSGLSINGSYSDDNLKLGIHIGSDPWRLLPRPPYHCHPQYPYVNWYPAFGYYDDYRSYFGNRYGTIYGNYSPLDPAMSAPPAPLPAPQTDTPTPSTDRELGDTYLQAGDPDAAIRAYNAHLRQYPGDENAMRGLGLALLEARKTPEGVAILAAAYRANPALADDPLPVDIYARGADTFRRNLQRVSVYANRVNSASAWLVLAAMMQAEGRPIPARSMMERAKKAGLEPAVADRMTAALR